MKDEMLDKYQDFLGQSAELVGQARREPDENKRFDLMKRVNELAGQMTGLYNEMYPK
jgi:hypothetical protein